MLDNNVGSRNTARTCAACGSCDTSYSNSGTTRDLQTFRIDMQENNQPVWGVRINAMAYSSSTTMYDGSTVTLANLFDKTIIIITNTASLTAADILAISDTHATYCTTIDNLIASTFVTFKCQNSETKGRYLWGLSPHNTRQSLNFKSFLPRRARVDVRQTNIGVSTTGNAKLAHLEQHRRKLPWTFRAVFAPCPPRAWTQASRTGCASRTPRRSTLTALLARRLGR